VVARLTALRASSGANLGDVVDSLVTELDGLRSTAKGPAREARRQCLERLQALDARLLASMRERLDPAAVAALSAEADVELAPFRDRMPPTPTAAPRRRASTAWCATGSCFRSSPSNDVRSAVVRPAQNTGRTQHLQTG
jgi:hypothetical protein